MKPSEITSDLSREDLLAVYMAACGYDAENDADAARCLIKAGRMLLARPLRSVSSSSRGETAEFEPRIVAEAVAAAQRWLSAYTDQTTPPRQLEPSPTWRD